MGAEYLLVVVQAESVFTPECLEYLRVLTEELWEVPHATDVVSLATMSMTRGTMAPGRTESYLPEGPSRTPTRYVSGGKP